MLSEEEQYFGKILPININNIFHLFPLGYQQRGTSHFRTIQTTDHYFPIFFLSIFCVRLFGDYIFENQVPSTKWHLPKVVVAWTVVRIPYLTTCWAQRCNKATFLSILKKIPSKVISKMGEYRIEIGKVRCGLGFYCYTRSLTHSERQSQ